MFHQKMAKKGSHREEEQIQLDLSVLVEFGCFSIQQGLNDKDKSTKKCQDYGILL